MAFYIVHTIHGGGTERETLSIYLHNIVKIFASRLDSLSLYCDCSRSKAKSVAGNKLCLCLSICHLFLRPCVPLSLSDCLSAHLTIVFIVSYNFQIVCTQPAASKEPKSMLLFFCILCCLASFSSILFYFFCGLSILCSVDYSYMACTFQLKCRLQLNFFSAPKKLEYLQGVCCDADVVVLSCPFPLI